MKNWNSEYKPRPISGIVNRRESILKGSESEVLNNSIKRRIYTLSANELVDLLGGEKNSKRRFEILSNVLAETDYTEWEIATNYVIFGEAISNESAG